MTACATAPDPLERLADSRENVFATAPEAPAMWMASGVAGEAPTADWLGEFNDPALAALVAEALENNPTVESRAALTRASRALARAARGGRWPTLGASLSAGGTSVARRIAANIERVDSELYGLGFDASWEADLWGRISNGIAQADADLAASRADLAATALSISGQTATAWISFNEAIAQERIAELTLAIRSRTLETTQRRVASGTLGALELRTARSAVASAEAAIAARRQVSLAAARRLEILLGRYPGAEISAPGEIPSLAPIRVEGNPALLLSRRPDIGALEARVVSAGLRAEEARLALLPSLRLSASASTSEADFADAIDPELIAARLVASLAQPVFNGGRLDALRASAIAQAEAAVASYAAGALNAWAEVEDALASDALLARQEDAQLRSLEEARIAEQLAERDFIAGTENIFNLIDAQTRRLNAESLYVSARADRARNRVAYHLALGGGVPDLPFAGDDDLFETPETTATGNRS